MSKWEYVRLGDLLVESKIPSENPDPSKRITVKLNVGGVEKRPYIEEVEGSTKYYIRKAGQFIYGKQNLHKGAFGIIPKELDGYESTIDLPAFDINTNRVLPEWLMLVFIKDNFYKELESISSGSATKRIHPERLFEVKIPLPSIDEQRNILNKYNRFKSNIEEINKLLIDMSNYITKLRQSILQEAVQGKLVPQDPNDEPASVLLERIKEEKERLIKEGKIKKEKPLPPISEDEIPYELPKGWEWVRLKEMTENIHYGYTASAIYNDTGIKFLRITDIQDNKVNWDTVPFCEIKEGKLKTYLLRNNDILIARTGSIGKSFIVKDIKHNAVFASYLIRVISLQGVNPDYIKLFLETPLYWEQLIRKSKGTGQPNVNAVSLSNLVIPLPPLNEQKRIVEKVDQLMALCDELEKNIEQSKKDCELLIQSVLQEAFKEA